MWCVSCRGDPAPISHSYVDSSLVIHLLHHPTPTPLLLLQILHMHISLVTLIDFAFYRPPVRSEQRSLENWGWKHKHRDGVSLCICHIRVWVRGQLHGDRRELNLKTDLIWHRVTGESHVHSVLQLLKALRSCPQCDPLSTVCTHSQWAQTCWVTMNYWI